MANIAYIDYRPSKATAQKLVIATTIIEEYQDEGFDLTLRQLYYQFVARDYIPNSDREYKKLGNVINKGRLGGLIDWDSITDRLRIMKKNSHWESPAEIIEACANQFKLDTRINQDTYIEVWVEKDAMSGVLGSVCPELDVSYMSCRGYVSQSAMWRAAIRFQERDQEGLLFYLGDHDPSGIDMTRDIQDRLNMFGCNDTSVERIALNMEQIEQYNPPPNPAKITDSRYENYVNKYGEESWELDALDPRTIVNLIEENVGNNTDQEKRSILLKEQRESRKQIRKIANNMN